MKRIITLSLALLLVLGLCACSGTDNKDLIGDASASKVYTVGLCNYVDDASLNQIEKAITDRLDAIGKSKGVAFRVLADNCNADANVMNQIIANFVAEKVDLMIGIATPVAVAMQAATEDNRIPVVYAAVSDPMGCNLADINGFSGTNITGTSDFLDTTAVLNLVFAADPGADFVALLYDNGQEASASSIDTAKYFLESKGISYREYTGTNTTEVVQAAQQIVSDGAKAVFTPTDNTIMKAELSIYEIFADAKIPHYAGANSFALNGAFLGYGVDYVNLGEKTADLVAEVLLDGKDAGKLAFLTFDNGTATVNTEICEKMGFDFETVKAAFGPYCSRVETIVTALSFDDLK